MELTRAAVMLEIIKNNIRPVPAREYKCNKCKDSGVLTEIGELGLPQILGECECVKVKRYKGIIEKTGLGIKLEECTFETFRADTEARKFAKKLCMEFVKDEKADNLLLLGTPGTGKTHLATAVCKELLEKHHKPLRYVSFRSLMQKIKALSLDAEGRAEEIDKYKKIPYLFIDDLFKNTNTNYTSEQQITFEILDYRYSNNKKTIVTSQCSLDELNNIDDAVTSRLAEKSGGYILDFKKMNIPSFRIDKALEDAAKLKRRLLGG